MESGNNSGDSQWLIERVAAGDDLAAEAVFRRYLRRLTALARAKLAPQVGRRVDPEDAVQSAFLSFFLGARSGRFTVEHSGDLWRLLATITARKASRLGIRHRAAKRSVHRETFPVDNESRSNFFPADERSPRPEEAALLADELVDVMQSLPLDLRQVLELRLQDTPVAEIAIVLGRTERTVRRKLEELRARLERRFGAIQDSNPARLLSSNENSDTLKTPDRPQIPLPAPSSAAGLPTIDYRDLLLLAHLGTGGTGRVYRAWQRESGRHVAVKVLKKSRQRDPRSVARFLTEIETVARFDHPGITQLYGLGRMPGGGYFFVTQLVEQGDLQQRIGAGDYTTEDVLRWMREATAAVAHAASRGVVHCDLKPSNILLDRDDRAVVSDFGFAVAFTGNAQPVGGTPAFLAPELLDERLGGISEATDVWGLGAILYALIYRRPPWPTVGNDRVWLKARTNGLEFPPTASPFLEICHRCLAISPRERYATADEVAAALDAVST